MARSLATSRPLLAARVLAGVVAASVLVLGASQGPGTASAGPLEDGAAVLLDPRSSTAGRVAACESIAEASVGKPRHDRALAALVPALADPEADVRAAAARALGRVRDAHAVPALTERLVREGDEVALTIVLLAIGRLGAASEVPSVTALRGHRSARVRAAVATTLGDLGGAEAREGLLRLLASPGVDEAWAVRGAALLALARVGRPEDAGAILVAYRDGDGASQWFARVALANAVAALDPDPMTVLDRLVADADPRVSAAAAVALVRSGREAEVVRRLSDARPGVRSASAVALAQTERRDHVPRLLSLAADDPDPGVRWSVTLALSRLDVAEADALVLAGVSSDDPEVWSTALGECRRKTGLALPRDPDACRAALAARRRGR